MAYEKQTWHTGDVITQEKLNHMEDGIANAGTLVVHQIYSETPPEWVHNYPDLTYEGSYYDVTPSQIEAALNNGKNIVIISYGSSESSASGWMTNMIYYDASMMGDLFAASLYYAYYDAGGSTNIQYEPASDSYSIISLGENDQFVAASTGPA